MGSKRFYGKSMYLFNGRPSLGHLLDSIVQYVDRGKIRVATTINKEDDPICDFCSDNGISYFRGDEINVALRFQRIVVQEEPDYFVRLNADSPLFDWRLLKKGLEQFRMENDICTTSISKKIPSGMNVEIINARTFLQEYQYFHLPSHFEHVTAYFYENKSRFRIIPIEYEMPSEFCGFKFSFDTEDDRIRLEKLFRLMDKDHYFLSLIDKCKLYQEL